MRTGHTKNHGKGFQVPAGPHSFESALKNSPLIEAHPLRCSRTRPDGLLYCICVEVKKPELSKINIQTLYRSYHP